MPQIEAIRMLRYAGRRHYPRDVFFASPSDARLLIAIGSARPARPAVEVAEGPVEPDPNASDDANIDKNSNVVEPAAAKVADMQPRRRNRSTAKDA